MRVLALPLLVAVAAACTPAATPPSVPVPTPAQPTSSDTLTLMLLGTTDVHGRVYNYDYDTGRSTDHGLALLKPLVDSIRTAHPDRTFLFDAGDLLQGNPLGLVYAREYVDDASPIIRAMNLMRYDASAIGNHEFNYGIEHLGRALSQANFPFVAANIFRAGTNEHAYRPYALLPVRTPHGDTLLIGVTGNTPPGVHLWDRANVTGILEFRDVVRSVRAVVHELRQRGADVVVVLSHGGLDGTSYDTVTTGLPPENASAELARQEPGIDMILLGHTHRELADTLINGVLLTQPKNWAASLSAARLTAQRVAPGEWRVIRKAARLLRPQPARADRTFMDSLRWEHERTVEYVNAHASVPGSASDGGRKRLRVVATNDFHGRLVSTTVSWGEGRPVGGAAVLASYFRHERAGFNGPVVLLDGGDVMQGTPLSNLTRGRSTIDYYNLAGYGGAALGNHEFDWGQDVLRQRMRQARFPWLAANIFVTGADTAPSWVRGTAVIDIESVRVGLIGLVTQDTRQTTMAAHVEGLTFADGAPIIDRWVPELRRRGADFVIVVAHEGLACAAETRDCSGTMADWARAVRNRPDLIVAGHTHQVVRTRINDIPIIETGSWGTRYGVVDLERVSADSVDVWIRGTPAAWADRVEPDTAIERVVQLVEQEIGPELKRVIVQTAERIERGAGENPMGRLIADAQRWKSGAQIAIMNAGGVRAPLPAGTVTWGDLYQVHPFGNTLVVLELTGAVLRDALEHAVRRDHPDAHVSGVVVTYDPSRPAGSRVVSLHLADGTPVRDERIYRVVVNDFLANGIGDGYTAFGRARARHPTGVVDLDALIEYIRTLPHPVRAPTDTRVRAVPPGR